MGVKLRHKKGRTQGEGVRVQGADEDTWAERDKVTGDWRKLHNEELQFVHLSN
jgi:hypothetical protein